MNVELNDQQKYALVQVLGRQMNTGDSSAKKARQQEAEEGEEAQDEDE